MNTHSITRTTFSSTYVQEQRMLKNLGDLLDSPLSPPNHPKMPHETSARILVNFYKTELRESFLYVRWEFSRHKTLGMIVEDYRTAIRWLWVIDFETCRPRRLVMVM